MSLSSDRHSEAELYDYGVYRMRQQLAVVQGTTFPLPYGGSSRQVSVDLDPQKLLAYGIAPQEVNAAVNAQNLILPTGTAKIGDREYAVSMNSSPQAMAPEQIAATAKARLALASRFRTQTGRCTAASVRHTPAIIE